MSDVPSRGELILYRTARRPATRFSHAAIDIASLAGYWLIAGEAAL